jgi:DNA-binding transcriptional MerR regulator
MSTYTLNELARAGGVTTRAVRYYLECGVLPSAVFRGTQTTYNEDHLLRLKVIRRLRTEERLRIDAIKRRLAQLSHDQIRALVLEPEPAPAAEPRAPASSPAYASQRWEHIVLLPGLELKIRSDASPLLVRLAEEIHARYGGPRAAEDAGSRRPGSK